MNILLFSAVAIFLYLFATVWWGFSALRVGTTERIPKARILAVSGVALLLHASVLYHGLFTGSGMNMGFFNALSLVAWAIACLVVLAALIRPVDNLAVVFFPAAALALLLELTLPGGRVLLANISIGLRIHILLSIAAYSVLAIGAMQALVLAFQEYQLRHKKPVNAMRMLPPLQIMEELLIQILALGFFLLSLSLATGLMFVSDLLAQHLTHKTVLSIVAWLIFGLVLLGRWRWGWRGPRLIRWTLGGFFALVLAYFGSKFVLELILHRV